jgi:hypothetical protein
MTNLTVLLKDRAIFVGWIAGLVLIASLLWSLSFPFRAFCLMRSTNKVLIAMDDSRRLIAPLPHSAVPVSLGCWYRFSDSTGSTGSGLFYVFALVQGGILVPCGAEISREGEVVDIIPLGNHARQIMKRTPPGLIQLYVRRIKSAAVVVAAAAAIPQGEK